MESANVMRLALRRYQICMMIFSHDWYFGNLCVAILIILFCRFDA